MPIKKKKMNKKATDDEPNLEYSININHDKNLFNTNSHPNNKPRKPIKCE